MEVKLNKAQKEFLMEEVLESHSSLKGIIEHATPHFEKYLIEVQPDMAEQIRDLCADRLMIIGFDEEYRLTKEGKMLERLIDLFFSES